MEVLSSDFGVVDEALGKRKVVCPSNSGYGVEEFGSLRAVRVAECVLDVAGFAGSSSDDELEGGKLGGRGSITVKDGVKVGVEEFLERGVLEGITRDGEFFIEDLRFAREDDT